MNPFPAFTVRTVTSNAAGTFSPLLLSSIPIPVRKRSSRPQEMRRYVYRIWMRDPDALLVQDARFEDEAQYVSYIMSKNGE